MLASAPRRVKTCLATSRMRSRLRWASERGLRAGFGVADFFMDLSATGVPLRYSYRITEAHSAYSGTSPLSKSIAGECRMAANFGAKSTTEDVLAGIDLKGKRILVTGVSAGLGVETARALVAHGADVVGAARDLTKAKAATVGVQAAVNNGGGLELVELDLVSLDSVRVCADALVDNGKPFDLVIANAGVMACPFGKTPDGV